MLFWGTGYSVSSESNGWKYNLFPSRSRVAHRGCISLHWPIISTAWDYTWFLSNCSAPDNSGKCFFPHSCSPTTQSLPIFRLQALSEDDSFLSGSFGHIGRYLNEVGVTTLYTVGMNGALGIGQGHPNDISQYEQKLGSYTLLLIQCSYVHLIQCSYVHL